MCMGLGAYTDIKCSARLGRYTCVVRMKMPGLAWRSEDYGNDEHWIQKVRTVLVPIGLSPRRVTDGPCWSSDIGGRGR